jgi:hypothetical protein
MLLTAFQNVLSRLTSLSTFDSRKETSDYGIMEELRDDPSFKYLLMLNFLRVEHLLTSVWGTQTEF